MGLLIGGGTPLLIGKHKRLFRAAGLALLPVVGVVVFQNILALVRAKNLIVCVIADLAGAGLDARISGGRLLLYHPAAVDVLFALRAGLCVAAAGAEDGVDVGNADTVPNASVLPMKNNCYGVPIPIHLVD